MLAIITLHYSRRNPTLPTLPFCALRGVLTLLARAPHAGLRAQVRSERPQRFSNATGTAVLTRTCQPPCKALSGPRSVYRVKISTHGHGTNRTSGRSPSRHHTRHSHRTRSCGILPRRTQSINSAIAYRIRLAVIGTQMLIPSTPLIEFVRPVRAAGRVRSRTSVRVRPVRPESMRLRRRPTPAPERFGRDCSASR